MRGVLRACKCVEVSGAVGCSVVTDRGHVASPDRPEGAPVLRRPGDGRGDHLPVPVRDRVADLPEVFGPWQTVWTWHRRMATDGTWDEVLAKLTAAADAAGLVDWSLSVDST